MTTAIPASRVLRERDRLLAVTARITGVASAVVALACLCLPEALDWHERLAPGALIALSALVLILLPRTRTVLFGLGVVALSIGAVALIDLAEGPLNSATAAAITAVAGGLAASGALVLVAAPLRWLSLTISSVAVIASSGFALAPDDIVGWHLALIVACWLAAVIAGFGIHRLVPHTLEHIGAMSQAQYAEHSASERHAVRRQSARLLHDTVLATLTLLAHSGVGVDEEALRQQAGGDAALLRQLRLGFDPQAAPAEPAYKPRPVEESALGNTLESVKHRFSRMGLDVKWHGMGQVLLPSDVLDAFLLALTECLENVRRHAQVEEADVTITDDDTTVRAMVTDAGVGFDMGAIDPHRLGFAESIVARLRDVGGKARLFSSPGSGTTVVLEVPK